MPTTTYAAFGGEIVSENRNGTIRDYVPDPLGSTRALLHNTQSQTDQWGYMPYGTATRNTGSNPTPFLFVGTKGYRSDTGTRAYVRARVLDTAMGRWLTEDPIQMLLRTWNPYMYVGSSPATYVDRSGLQAEIAIGGGVGCIVGGLVGGILGGYLHHSACYGLCEAAIGCITGGLVGIVTALDPEEAPGCLAGLAAGGVAALGDVICSKLCPSACADTGGPDLACEVWQLILNAIFGCIAGALDPDDPLTVPVALPLGGIQGGVNAWC